MGLKKPQDRRKVTAQQVADQMTTREVIERLLRWWKDNGRMKASTLHVMRNVARKYLLPVLGDTPWRSVTQALIDQLVSEARDMASPRHLQALRSVMRDCHRIGIAPPLYVKVELRYFHRWRKCLIGAGFFGARVYWPMYFFW